MAKKLKFKVGDEVVFLKNYIGIPIGTTATVIRFDDSRYPVRVELESGWSFLCLESELDFYAPEEPEKPFIPPANNQGVGS